jgi:hypothetical protein
MSAPYQNVVSGLSACTSPTKYRADHLLLTIK